jgi:hypothetical protein
LISGHRADVSLKLFALRTDGGNVSRIVGVPPVLDEVARSTAPQQSSQSDQNIRSAALTGGLVPNGGSLRLATS